MQTSSSQAINDLDELRVAIAFHERRAAEIGVAVASLATSGSWGLDGSVSMAAWMRHHLRMSHSDASKWLREGRFLASYEPVLDAAVSGFLSAGQVAALARAVTPATTELFAEHAADLVATIAPLPVVDAQTVCGAWRTHAEALVETPEPKVPDRSWNTSSLDDGTMLGTFVLDPNGAALLTQALGAAKQFAKGDERTVSQRDADAFVDIISFFLANQDWNGTPRHRPHVELHLHEETDPTSQIGLRGFNLNGVNLYLKAHAFTSRGKQLSEAVTLQHLCDCVIHRVMHRGSAVMDFGRSTRTIPHNLFRATACRDGGCRFPGCDRPVAWTQGHHIWHWEHGGPTKLSNLILLCTKHHGIVHSGQWSIKLEPDGEAIFTKPNGLVRTSKPRGSPNKRDPIAA
jgi:hypothetical protein